MNDSHLKMSLTGIPCDFMYKIITFKFSKPRLSPFCSCWWNLLAIFHLFSSFLSWYVNTHMHTYIHICVYIHSHIFTHAHVYTYMHIYVHMHPHVQVYIHAHIRACLQARVHMCYVPVCTLACTCAYVCNARIYVHIYTQPKTLSPATCCWVTGLLSLPHSISLFISQIRTKPLGSSGETVRESTSGGLQPRSSRTKPSWESSNSSLSNHHSP